MSLEIDSLKKWFAHFSEKKKTTHIRKAFRLSSMESGNIVEIIGIILSLNLSDGEIKEKLNDVRKFYGIEYETFWNIIATLDYFILSDKS